MVYLSTENLSSHQMPKVPRKLWYRFIGPFEITKKISDVVYELDLPDEYRIENPFHISLLKPYHPPESEDQIFRPPPSFFVQGDAEYPVEAILDRKGSGKSRQYLVKWEGLSDEENTWEPATHLQRRELQPLLRDFNEDFDRRKRSRNH